MYVLFRVKVNSRFVFEVFLTEFRSPYKGTGSREWRAISVPPAVLTPVGPKGTDLKKERWG